MLDFIPDGYTRTVGFDETPGVHRRFHFSYRPFVGPQRAKALAVIDGDVNNAVGVLQERLTDWSFEGAIDEHKLSTLPSEVFDKLYLSILKLQTPDFEIDADGKELRPTLNDEKQAAADAKN